ncbi:hypothetical protein CB17B1026 [Clostridium botulinum B str. Eklund 17B (NRP)]|nr:hypothetical protein CB17B1026 [Clostridium botulinum B str. Eklund 17B (NRP)]
MQIILDIIVSNTIVIEKYSLAFLFSPLPKAIEITVDDPIENNTDNPKIKFVYGIAKFTAANASELTPLLTNIASTIIYKAEIHIEAIDGITYLKKSLFKAVLLFLENIKFTYFTSLFKQYYKLWYNTQVKRFLEKIGGNVYEALL